MILSTCKTDLNHYEKTGVTGMSKGRDENTPLLPGLQAFFSGRPAISAKEKLKRAVAEMRSQELWEFKQLFGAWLPEHVFRLKSDSGCSTRVFTPPLVFWAFLSQVMLDGMSCASVVKKW